jgi:hypothetical protein
MQIKKEEQKAQERNGKEIWTQESRVSKQRKERAEEAMRKRVEWELGYNKSCVFAYFEWVQCLYRAKERLPSSSSPQDFPLYVSTG